MGNEITLKTLKVKEIAGDFLVPSYQRGYRWGNDEVKRLLDDVYEHGESSNKQMRYCLQPIVVRRCGKQYELIDGQQRLTTIYLIQNYLHNIASTFFSQPRFTLSYQTREASAEYLKSPSPERGKENIDFWFIRKAYECIEQWFNPDRSILGPRLNDYLSETVVIWYEVGSDEDPIQLFTRLNIGKIPLTSAELVKAMFLAGSSTEPLGEDKQDEIALQWDNIERELGDNRLWYFLTNNEAETYQTRIDLILDLIARRPNGTRDKYYTFFCIDGMRKKGKESLEEIWKRIQQAFLQLKDWWQDHELYHKVGYLIASRTKTLPDIYGLSRGKTKQAFRSELDGLIKKSVNFGRNAGELSYDNTNDHKHIYTLLLLFNVESVRQNAQQSQWFPFDKFKRTSESFQRWTLEHIHAQQSEVLNTKKAWQEWLDLHMHSVKTMSPVGSDLPQRMEAAIGSDALTREIFEQLQSEAVEILSEKGSDHYLHSLANLTLLNLGSNTALSNSTFDVKRNKIIEMDKNGEYIPFCTRMVFLKYYTPSDENQLHFWGQADRKAYIDAMNSVLDGYLREKIENQES